MNLTRTIGIKLGESLYAYSALWCSAEMSAEQVELAKGIQNKSLSQTQAAPVYESRPIMGYTRRKRL